MARLFILLTLLLLQGCSAIKLGYQQLPTLSYWWLDNTVSFSGPQTPAAKEAIDKLYQWHRRDELHGYASLLQRTAELSAGPVQSAQLCRVLDEVQARMDTLMRQAVTQAADRGRTWHHAYQLLAHRQQRDAARQKRKIGRAGHGSPG